jgi:arylsulfatase A-like enzyme
MKTLPLPRWMAAPLPAVRYRSVNVQSDFGRRLPRPAEAFGQIRTVARSGKPTVPRCVALAAVLLSLAGPAWPAASRPNVLLIVTDDQRPDTIHALGNTYIDTPNLDRLVAEGSAFTRAIAAIPHCMPSRAEIMTGTSGFRNHSPPFGEAIDPKLVLWANVMRGAGYHTWYCGKWMNDGTPLTRGYEETRAMYAAGGGGNRPLTLPTTAHNGLPVGSGRTTFRLPNSDTADLEKGIGRTPRSDEYVADAAIEFLRRRVDQPFFLHVNFTAPHDPRHIHPKLAGKYNPATIPLPPNFLPEHPFDHGNAAQRDEGLLPLPRTVAHIRTDLAAYYADITHLDEQLGRVLEALRQSGRQDETIVIFTSDHGLALGSHGLIGKQNMYDHTIGVPLIIRGPGIPKGQRFAAQVYLRDLYPTVCELVNLPVPETVESRSFAAVLAGRAQQIHAEVYAYWHRAEYSAELPIQRMVRTERWKLIYYSHLRRYQLFDLAADPHELRDLSGEPAQAAMVAELRQKLDGWFAPRMVPYANLAAKPRKRGANKL